ncbi:hypothetical protein J6590_083536 [Homalodisca vitripennis]|nr:hypothetical protein J6590_083536 [Homalodisca vitripennis]
MQTRGWLTQNYCVLTTPFREATTLPEPLPETNSLLEDSSDHRLAVIKEVELATQLVAQSMQTWKRAITPLRLTGRKLAVDNTGPVYLSAVTIIFTSVSTPCIR